MSTQHEAQQATHTGQQREPVKVDYSETTTDYVNFCRVNWTPEEVIVDFGLKTAAGNTGSDAVQASNRVIMNFYTAKRMLGALHYAIQHYEHTFGPLEMDASKRAQIASDEEDE